MGSPLHIEPGLDGATVVLQLVPRLPRNAWGLYLYQGLGFGLFFTPAWWLGLLLLVSSVVVAAMLFRERRRAQQLELEVTPTEVRHRGRPVRVRADFQYIWVDDRPLVIDGGLTRKEHARLTALITPRELGEHAEVDPRLRQMQRARE